MTEFNRPPLGPGMTSSGPVISSSPIGAAAHQEPEIGPHRVAGDTEEVYFQGSPLLRGEFGRGLIWIFVGLFFIALPFVLYHFRIPREMPWWLWPNLIVLGLILMLIPWVQAKTIKYRITNYRIDLQTGVLSRSIDTVELWHVEDLRFHQTIADRIMGVGDITIISRHPTIPMLTMRSLPKAQQIFTALEQRVISVKRGSGVIKVDTGNT